MENIEINSFQNEEKEKQEYTGFVVDSMEKAEWAVKKIAMYEQKKQEIQDFVTAEIQKYTDYLAKMQKEYDFHIEYLTNILKPYAEEQIKGTKMKSFKLPSGRLQFRISTSYIKDDEKLLSYCQSNSPEYLKNSVNWEAFKKKLNFDESGRAVTSDGEVLDFITCEKTQNFKVEL